MKISKVQDLPRTENVEGSCDSPMCEISISTQHLDTRFSAEWVEIFQALVF